MIIGSPQTESTGDTDGVPPKLASAELPDRSAFEREFDRLAAEWKEHGEYLSSPTAIANLPAYRAIIAMGKPALPLILRDLQKEPDLWFMALKRIAGESPVRKADRGNIVRMTEAWLQWGREHGLIA
jgi:hypothetical protein